MKLGLGFGSIKQGDSFDPLVSFGAPSAFLSAAAITGVTDGAEIESVANQGDASFDWTRNGAAGTGFIYKQSGLYGVPELTMAGSSSSLSSFQGGAGNPTLYSNASGVTVFAYLRSTIAEDASPTANSIIDMASSSAAIRRYSVANEIQYYQGSSPSGAIETAVASPDFNKQFFVAVTIASDHSAVFYLDGETYAFTANDGWDNNGGIRVGYNSSGSDDDRVKEYRPSLRNILVAGQSNAEGRTPLGDGLVPGSYTHADQITMLQNDFILRAGADPVDANTGAFSGLMDNSGVGFGYMMPMADELVDLMGFDVNLVPAARGGTRIAQWQRNDSDPDDATTYYGVMLRAAREALKFGGLDVMVWHQGESDAVDAKTQAAYEVDLQAMIADFRSDIGLAHLPVIIVKLHAWHSDISATEAEWEAIQDAQAAVVSALDDAYLVDASDLAGAVGDRIHLSAASYLTLGDRLATAIYTSIYGGA